MIVDENGNPFVETLMNRIQKKTAEIGTACSFDFISVSRLKDTLNPNPVTRIAEEITGKKFSELPTTLTMRRYLPFTANPKKPQEK